MPSRASLTARAKAAKAMMRTYRISGALRSGKNIRLRDVYGLEWLNKTACCRRKISTHPLEPRDAFNGAEGPLATSAALPPLEACAKRKKQSE